MPIDLFNYDVQAFVTSVSYKPKTRTGYLRLAHMHVPDMTGSIKMFTQIDPHALLILVYDGRHHNTTYAKIKGKWECTYLNSTFGRSAQ